MCTKDLNAAELDTKKVSKNPTTVVTANGEEQTKEDATVYVKELDLFVTVMLLEDTPAVLSFGKLCDDHGYSFHWTSGQKPQLIKNGRRTKCNTANCVPIVVPGLSTGSSSSASVDTTPTCTRADAKFSRAHITVHNSLIEPHGLTQRIIVAHFSKNIVISSSCPC